MLDIIINDLPSYAKFLSYQKQNPNIDITIKNIHLTNTDITIFRLLNVIKIEEDFIIENNYELKIIIESDKLKNIGGHFRIVNNWYLRSINGFNNLENILNNTSKNNILACETSDILTSCKRGFVIKNNWNLENLPTFTNLNVPDDKVGDEEYFLIMNNPNYNFEEIKMVDEKRNLWENIKFNINLLNDNLDEEDSLSKLNNVQSIDNNSDKVQKNENTIKSPNIDYYNKQINYYNGDVIAFYIGKKDNKNNYNYQPFFISMISSVKENNNLIEIEFNSRFERYLNNFDTTIHNKIKLVRMNNLRFNPNLFVFNPLNVCSINSNNSCFLPTFITFKKFKDARENNEKYQTDIVKQNKEIYFNFGNVYTLEHFFKFSQFCLAEKYFDNLVILDGSLSISNFIQIEGITNLKKITGNFNIFNNPNLINLKNFDNLEEVSGNFILYENPKLNYIGDFTKLAYNQSTSNLTQKILVKNSGTKTITSKNKLIDFLIKSKNKNIKKPININNVFSIFSSIIITIIIFFLFFNNNNK